MPEVMESKRSAKTFSDMKVFSEARVPKELSLSHIETHRNSNAEVSKALKLLSDTDKSKNMELASSNIGKLLDKSNAALATAEKLLKENRNEEALASYRTAVELQRAAGYATTAIGQSLASNAEAGTNVLKAFAVLPSNAMEAASNFEAIAMCSIGQPWAGAAIAAASTFVLSDQTRKALDMAPLGKADYVMASAGFLPIGKVAKVVYTAEEVELLGKMYRPIAKAMDLAHSAPPKVAQEIITEALDSSEDIAKLGERQQPKSSRNSGKVWKRH